MSRRALSERGDNDEEGGSVDIPDLKLPNLARAQAIDSEQAEDRSVAPLQWRVALCVHFQAGDLLSRRPDRNAFIAIGARREDRCRQALSYPASGFAVAEPTAQETGRSQ